MDKSDSEEDVTLGNYRTRGEDITKLSQSLNISLDEAQLLLKQNDWSVQSAINVHREALNNPDEDSPDHEDLCDKMEVDNVTEKGDQKEKLTLQNSVNYNLTTSSVSFLPGQGVSHSHDINILGKKKGIKRKLNSQPSNAGGKKASMLTKHAGIGNYVAVNNTLASNQNNDPNVAVPPVRLPSFNAEVLKIHTAAKQFSITKEPKPKKEKRNKKMPPAKGNVKNAQQQSATDSQSVPTKAVDGAEPEPEEDVDIDEMGVAETFADYKPAKLKFGIGHPDPVVETASLAGVLPPKIQYELHLPRKIIDEGLLSALQLESVVYACQQHEHILSSGERAGFLIGDGAGVGKGRTIAGIIYENFICGRKKAIWVSVSADLKYDSERDIQDIGAKMDVYALNKLKYGKIPATISKGVIFSTYASLIGQNSTRGAYNTRLKQLVNWCGKDFDGVIVFDECHRAKNLVPSGGNISASSTKTGLAVQELQSKLPKARVVYASATGASEPRNMAYMSRLGIWGPSTPFTGFSEFIRAVERRGVGAMEIVAMDMKLRGTYIARQLSFRGVKFNIEECPLDDDYIKVYDESVQLWVDLRDQFIEAADLMGYGQKDRRGLWCQFWAAHQRFFKYLCISSKVKRTVDIAKESLKLGKCVVIGLQSTGEARTLDQLDKADGDLNEFASSAKGVVENLVDKQFPGPRMEEDLVFNFLDDEADASGSIRKPTRRAAQVAAKRSKAIFADDDSFDQEDDDDSDSLDHDSSSDDDESYMSDAKSNASTDSHHLDDDGGVKTKVESRKSASTIISTVRRMKQNILTRIEKLGERLPPNALDQLLDELGGPDAVAEMTGRKGRVVKSEDGEVYYESRGGTDTPLETINLIEKQRFMDGEKRIAIISEAASSGISLQSDKRAKNTSIRVHITLELPWSADRAIQQFGRTHRSNQVNLPEYVFLISKLAGENRFASVVAKRLESLGALTHGDRRATESRDLSRFHIDTKYGKQALDYVLRTVLDYEYYDTSLVTPKSDYPSVGEFFKALQGALLSVGLLEFDPHTESPKLEKDHKNMGRFLNRILGIPVGLQNSLFQFLSDALHQVVVNAKRNGLYDLGILDLGDSGSGGIKKLEGVKYKQTHATGDGKIYLHNLQVERGLSWDDAMAKFDKLESKHEGFYISSSIRNNKRTAILVVQVHQIQDEDDDKLYYVYRPSTGLQLKRELLTDLTWKYQKCNPERARPYWINQYDSSKTTCIHAFWAGNCKARMLGVTCDVGLRVRKYYVLSGSVLMVWDTAEKVLAKNSSAISEKAKIQVIRVRDDSLKIVGILIPNYCAADLMAELDIECDGSEKLTYESDDED